jgi:hypothetical protein
MNKRLRLLIDKPTLWITQFKAISKLIEFFSYQQKRVLRRSIEKRLQAEGIYGDTVIRGPFRGLQYPANEWASCKFEKIIGAYEHDVFPLIERLASTQKYRTILNIGSADGYFSIGLAKLFPQAIIHSYEERASSQNFCRKLAALNNVSDQIKYHGRCSPGYLASFSPEKPVLVWMDIDTGEREVLDPDKVPWLKDADIFVELHDCIEAGLSELIRKRFSQTHTIEHITMSGLDYIKYDELQNLTFLEIYAMTGEDRRGLQDWFFMTPKSPKILQA